MERVPAWDSETSSAALAAAIVWHCMIDRLMDARPLWEGEAFLEKPFSLEDLREVVSLLLYGTVRR
jgi:hypothetical protein